MFVVRPNNHGTPFLYLPGHILRVVVAVDLTLQELPTASAVLQLPGAQLRLQNLVLALLLAPVHIALKGARQAIQRQVKYLGATLTEEGHTSVELWVAHDHMLFQYAKFQRNHSLNNLTVRRYIMRHRD